MKSAYELAMERLKSEEGEYKPLTDKQKKELAEIEKRYQAKIAEREIFLRKTLEEVIAQGDEVEAEKIRKEMVEEKVRLEEEMEVKKQKVRKGK